MLKKIFSLLSLILVSAMLTACGAESAGQSGDQATAEAQKAHKVLVVYFSGSGNTEKAANYIAEATGGDIFTITPAQPYTDDDLNYRDENSRVIREHDDMSLRDIELVQNTPDNWADYDTVFIGYPLWWRIAAWPVSSFVEKNDFAGKTVIPFATSISDDIGESGNLLANAAGTGNWLEGRRFPSRPAQEGINTWMSELGLSK